MGHLDGGDRLLLEQHLFAGEDLLEEILVDLAGRREEVLEVLVHVLIEIGLGLELPLQLLGPHEAEAPLLGAAVDLVPAHVVIGRRVFEDGDRVSMV